MFSLIGLLWSIPHGYFDRIQPDGYVNWGTITIVAALLYYLRLSFTIFLGMFLVSAGMIAGNAWVSNAAGTPLWIVSLTIFIVAWIGQFIAHKIEGKKPSFFKDLQFLLIGPAWLLGFIYRKIGIRY